jgi:hypothetical protein
LMFLKLWLNFLIFLLKCWLFYKFLYNFL